MAYLPIHLPFLIAGGTPGNMPGVPSAKPVIFGYKFKHINRALAMGRKNSGKEPEHTYDKIVWARNILDLPESVRMREIKDNYRRLIRKWHPDKCREDTKICRDMTDKIIQAHKIIIYYCSQYRFSFSRQEVEKYLSAEEWWLKKFGADPVWGSENSQQKK